MGGPARSGGRRLGPGSLGRLLVGATGLDEANQANLAAGTEAEPNQALGWLPMQDIDAAAEAAAQPSHALGWLPIEEIDAAASDDGEVSSSPQLPPRPFMMPHTPSGG